jgi:hypothetical protein
MRQLPLALVEQAAANMQLLQFEQHSIVYDTADDASHFYIVLAGTHQAAQSLVCYANLMAQIVISDFASDLIVLQSEGIDKTIAFRWCCSTYIG